MMTMMVLINDGDYADDCDDDDDDDDDDDNGDDDDGDDDDGDDDDGDMTMVMMINSHLYIASESPFSIVSSSSCQINLRILKLNCFV